MLVDSTKTNRDTFTGGMERTEQPCVWYASRQNHRLSGMRTTKTQTEKTHFVQLTLMKGELTRFDTRAETAQTKTNFHMGLR